MRQEHEGNAHRRNFPEKFNSSALRGEEFDCSFCWSSHSQPPYLSPESLVGSEQCLPALRSDIVEHVGRGRMCLWCFRLLRAVESLLWRPRASGTSLREAALELLDLMKAPCSTLFPDKSQKHKPARTYESTLPPTQMHSQPNSLRGF